MAGAPADPLRFVDRFAIGELVADYAHGVDRLELDRLVELFTVAGELHVHGAGEHAPATGVRIGREEILAAMRSLERYEVTAHHLAQHRVRFVPPVDGAPARATGELYCTAHHISVVDGVRSDWTLSLRYLDDYVVDGGRWRFARRRVCTDFADRRSIDPTRP
jgi:hypothetical protein